MSFDLKINFDFEKLNYFKIKNFHLYLEDVTCSSDKLLWQCLVSN